MSSDLPYCTECRAPRIAVFELADGTTRCTACIEFAIRESEREWQVRDFLRNIQQWKRNA